MSIKNTIIGVLVIVCVVLGGLLSVHWQDNSKAKSNTQISRTQQLPGVDSTEFQGVFLNSGQVYFGHLSTNSNGDFELTDVYYLSDNKTDLVKLGSEVHQPQDKMTIIKSNVTFWENLQHANQFNGRLR